MKPQLGVGRYLAEWCLVVLAGILLGEGVKGVIEDPVVLDRFRPSVIWAVLVIGLVDPVVYVMVARGLVVSPKNFFNLWGLSLLAKMFWYGAAGAGVAFSGLVNTGVFALALAAAFPVFTAHQVLSLVRLAKKSGAIGGTSA